VRQAGIIEKLSSRGENGVGKESRLEKKTKALKRKRALKRGENQAETREKLVTPGRPEMGKKRRAIQ